MVLFNYIKPILFYLTLINLLGFFIMGYDKSAAKQQKWRIAERRLFMIAVFGGAVGSYLGMRTFRHKTKHWYFQYGIPVVMVLQVILIIYLLTAKVVIID